MGSVMMGSLIAAGAMDFQYILPARCIAAAIMSAFGRRKRLDLVSGVVGAQAQIFSDDARKFMTPPLLC